MIVVVFLVMTIMQHQSLAQTTLPPVESLTFSEKNFVADNLVQIPKARQLALTSDNSVLFVGTSSDKVYGVQLSKDHLGKYNQKAGTSPVLVASGLDTSAGVAVDDSTGNLYVGCNDGIYRIPYAVTSVKYASSFATKSKILSLTPQTQMNRRVLMIKGDRLFVTIGSACDSCNVTDPLGTISSFKYNTDDSSLQDFKVEARGIRNSVGMDFHPVTGELWFTDNGRDIVNSDRPYDELNRLPASATNINFGFPLCFEKDFADPDSNLKGDCKEYVGAENVLGSHVAALGMTFVRGTNFPESYRSKPMILIAERGSIKVNPPSGYRISMIDPTDSSSASYKTFATGFFNQTAWGRPVDVINMADGSVLVSDDFAGAVYRMSYFNPEKPSAAAQSFTFGITMLLCMLMFTIQQLLL